MSERTVTVGEAAEQLGITEKAVRRRIERGVLASLIGPDRRRRIPLSALGASPQTVTANGTANGDGASGGASAPRRAPAMVRPYDGDVLERLERLARENGQLRQIEIVAGDREAQLIEANARIRELEAKLGRRRWWRR